MYATAVTGNIAQTNHMVHGLDLDASDPDHENWSEVTWERSEGPFDITYRANGEKLLCWSGSGLHTSSGDIDAGFEVARKLSVYTNPGNRRDLVGSWHCDITGGGVAVCRELLP